MSKLKIKDYRRKEHRYGRETQYILEIECELEPNNKTVYISTVVQSEAEMEDLYKDIAYVINAGNSAIENPT